MGQPAFAWDALAWWSAMYSDHQAVSVTVRFLHLAGLIVGGGTALAADRHVLGTVPQDTVARSAALAMAGASHRIVVPALALMALTGLLMATADLETYLSSRLFWIKMAIVGLLLLNGGVLVLAERAAARGAGDRTWARLRTVSAASVVLWLSALLAGTWLTVGA
jgi:uncharacterized membrane protein